VQSVSFSIIYLTSILLKSGVNFFGVTLISDGVLSWVSWLNMFMENIDVAACESLPTQFAAVKLPKCLEGPHNTYDRSTNSSKMQHSSRSNSRDGHSSTHDTREGSSQKRIHGATINGTPFPASLKLCTGKSKAGENSHNVARCLSSQALGVIFHGKSDLRWTPRTLGSGLCFLSPVRPS